MSRSPQARTTLISNRVASNLGVSVDLGRRDLYLPKIEIVALDRNTQGDHVLDLRVADGSTPISDSRPDFDGCVIQETE